MKAKPILLLSLCLIASARAQIRVLPPDFTLFGKTSADYVADWWRFNLSLSTNGDYLLPHADAPGAEPVFVLQRIIPYAPKPGLQTYFLPDDVYLFSAIVTAEWDNVDACPPCFTVEQLEEIVRAQINSVTELHVVIDGVALTNLFAHRAPSGAFSVYEPNPDNGETLNVGHPVVGLIDPVVADGYFLMFAPFPAGIYEFHTGATVGGPNGFSFDHHFQIKVLSRPEWLAYQTGQLRQKLPNAAVPSNCQRPLLASLDGAEASFEVGNLRAGANQLRAFRQKLRVQVAPEDAALAEQLGREVQAIINKAETGPN